MYEPLDPDPDPDDNEDDAPQPDEEDDDDGRHADPPDEPQPLLRDLTKGESSKSIAGDSKGINPQGPIIHLGRVRHSAASSTGLGCSRVEGPVLCRDAVTDFRYGILETS